MENYVEIDRTIRDNYKRVIDRINKSASSVGRDPEDIRLVVVTKTQPVEIIRSVIAAGAINLGENYIEEAVPKIEVLGGSERPIWHMIGHLQRRKTENFCKYFDYLHSLDSLKLAIRLDQLASLENKRIPVWLEFNTAGEASKSGWDISIRDNWVNLIADIEQIIHLPNLDVLGVMTVPPFSESSENSRQYFLRLKEFQEFVINQLHPSRFTECSMGMSSDFEVAIQEGSTCLRIGQAILGPRPR